MTAQIGTESRNSNIHILKNVCVNSKSVPFFSKNHEMPLQQDAITYPKEDVLLHLESDLSRGGFIFFTH